jgi:two-component system response regulator FlrC
VNTLLTPPAAEPTTPQPLRASSLASSRVSGVRQAVFVDPVSQQLLALAQRVAQADVTTLLVGPTGAGKEILARVLHETSARSGGPFVAINCAALPENLIEDQLFGHDKGAFTGAHRDHKGLFEQADGGTLFLDEIGEMPMGLQAKLLRVLQDRQVVRLGGSHSVQVNVRVVAATNRDLRQAIAEREFREDLYYRIATFRLRLPPLAERPLDILPLAYHFLSQHRSPGAAWTITPAAQASLYQYPWPGNVRELENVMRRAVVLSTDGVVDSAQLMFDESIDGAAWELPAVGAPAAVMPQPAAAPMAAPVSAPQDLQTAVRDREWHLVQAAIAAAPSRSEAARMLGISPRTLRHKIAQWRVQGVCDLGEALQA